VIDTRHLNLAFMAMIEAQAQHSTTTPDADPEWHSREVRRQERTNATWEKVRKTVEQEAFSGYQLLRLHEEIFALSYSEEISDIEVYEHTMAFFFRLTREVKT